jgi:hypothetical protein
MGAASLLLVLGTLHCGGTLATLVHGVSDVECNDEYLVSVHFSVGLKISVGLVENAEALHHLVDTSDVSQPTIAFALNDKLQASNADRRWIVSIDEIKVEPTEELVDASARRNDIALEESVEAVALHWTLEQASMEEWVWNGTGSAHFLVPPVRHNNRARTLLVALWCEHYRHRSFATRRLIHLHPHESVTDVHLRAMTYAIASIHNTSSSRSGKVELSLSSEPWRWRILPIVGTLFLAFLLWKTVQAVKVFDTRNIEVAHQHLHAVHHNFGHARLSTEESEEEDDDLDEAGTEERIDEYFDDPSSSPVANDGNSDEENSDEIEKEDTLDSCPNGHPAQLEELTRGTGLDNNRRECESSDDEDWSPPSIERRADFFLPTEQDELRFQSPRTESATECLSAPVSLQPTQCSTELHEALSNAVNIATHGSATNFHTLADFATAPCAAIAPPNGVPTSEVTAALPLSRPTQAEAFRGATMPECDFNLQRDTLDDSGSGGHVHISDSNLQQGATSLHVSYVSHRHDEVVSMPCEATNITSDDSSTHKPDLVSVRTEKQGDYAFEKPPSIGFSDNGRLSASLNLPDSRAGGERVEAGCANGTAETLRPAEREIVPETAMQPSLSVAIENQRVESCSDSLHTDTKSNDLSEHAKPSSSGIAMSPLVESSIISIHLNSSTDLSVANGEYGLFGDVKDAAQDARESTILATDWAQLQSSQVTNEPADRPSHFEMGKVPTFPKNALGGPSALPEQRLDSSATVSGDSQGVSSKMIATSCNNSWIQHIGSQRLSNEVESAKTQSQLRLPAAADCANESSRKCVRLGEDTSPSKYVAFGLSERTKSSACMDSSSGANGHRATVDVSNGAEKLVGRHGSAKIPCNMAARQTFVDSASSGEIIPDTFPQTTKRDEAPTKQQFYSSSAASTFSSGSLNSLGTRIVSTEKGTNEVSELGNKFDSTVQNVGRRSFIEASDMTVSRSLLAAVESEYDYSFGAGAIHTSELSQRRTGTEQGTSQSVASTISTRPTNSPDSRHLSLKKSTRRHGALVGSTNDVQYIGLRRVSDEVVPEVVLSYSLLAAAESAYDGLRDDALQCKTTKQYHAESALEKSFASNAKQLVARSGSIQSPSSRVNVAAELLSFESVEDAEDVVEYIGSRRVSEEIIPDIPLSHSMMAAIESVNESCWVYDGSGANVAPRKRRRSRHSKSIKVASENVSKSRHREKNDQPASLASAAGPLKPHATNATIAPRSTRTSKRMVGVEGKARSPTASGLNTRSSKRQKTERKHR